MPDAPGGDPAAELERRRHEQSFGGRARPDPGGPPCLEGCFRAVGAMIAAVSLVVVVAVAAFR